MYYITPRSKPSENFVVHLAYTSVGPGHYDGLVIKHPPRGTVTSEKIKCRCGVNSKHNKENFIACAHQVGKHSSCRCLAKGQSCSEICGCKGCNNPNGRRPTVMKSRRSREPHTWQLIDTSDKFFADTTRGVWSEIWSEFENSFFQHRAIFIFKLK